MLRQMATTSTAAKRALRSHVTDQVSAETVTDLSEPLDKVTKEDPQFVRKPKPRKKPAKKTSPKPAKKRRS